MGNSKRRLFEVMQKVNPDFVINEANLPARQQQPEQGKYYSPAELDVLSRMAYNVRMHGYMIHSPLTKDIIYDFNQKHGNVIEFPLVSRNKEDVINDALTFIYGNKATDENRKYLETLDEKQLIDLIEKRWGAYEYDLRANILKAIKSSSDNKAVKALPQDTSDNSWVDTVVKTRLDQVKREKDGLIHDVHAAYKYLNAVSSGNNMSSNFYEMYPFAQPITESDWKTERYSSDQMIEITKKLMSRGAIIVIPFTEEEKVAMNKVYGGSKDYLTPTWGHGKDGFAHLVFLEDPAEIIRMEEEYRTTNFKFTKQTVEDLFVTAIEGGTNYWALWDVDDIPSKNIDPRPISEKIIDAVWTYKKSVPVYDVESGDIDLTNPWVRRANKDNTDSSKDFFEKHGFEKLGDLNLQGVFKALEMLKTDERYSHILHNIANDNHDAGDADAFFQLAIMGEIVFG